jgi:hypothetical protein
MEEVLYQVVLLNGSISSELYKTRQDAVRSHRGNISKLVEVVPRTTKKTKVDMSSVEALLISKRSNDDLVTSLDCGYAVTYNCPKRDRLYDGMRYLEVSDEQVLEAEVIRIEKYEKGVHHHWKGPGYKPDKEWEWAIYHKRGRIIDRRTAEKKYNNPLKGTQGGISYIKIP